jgi:hypothetical protein
VNFHICIVQPPGYIHTGAFTELAELLLLGLGDLGHGTSIGENQFVQGATNIIIGAHLLTPDHIRLCLPSSIIVNTEQIGGKYQAWDTVMREWARHFETWDYSAANIAMLRAHTDKPVRLLRLGYHPGLARIRRAPVQDIDVLFYGTRSPRRRGIFDALEHAGLRFQHLFGIYGNERDAITARSKIVLNIHNHQTQVFEIVRAFYLMINRKAIVSEIDDRTSIDPEYRSGVCGAAYPEIVDACRALISDEKSRLRLEDAAYAAISRLPQAELLAPLLDAAD